MGEDTLLPMILFYDEIREGKRARNRVCEALAFWGGLGLDHIWSRGETEMGNGKETFPGLSLAHFKSQPRQQGHGGSGSTVPVQYQYSTSSNRKVL